jgi:hypothetical protein
MVELERQPVEDKKVKKYPALFGAGFIDRSINYLVLEAAPDFLPTLDCEGLVFFPPFWGFLAVTDIVLSFKG